ncbi:MAG TPA: hypothetical protein VLI90_15235 [Tepidisphaeraceae bacterium]|nr:hypothetical protein [Tepidisphaeraceae bacterium]
MDCLEHVVEFKVPAEKVGELARFDGSVIDDGAHWFTGGSRPIFAYR